MKQHIQQWAKRLVSAVAATTALTAAALAASGAFAQQQNSSQSAASALEPIVIRKARILARQDYQGLPSANPAVTDMTYQEYRAIRFRPEAAFWRGESLFELQLFHTGFIYEHPVQINLATEDSRHDRVAFDPKLFRYDKGADKYADVLSENAGYAGFRVHYPLNTSEYKDEVVVFQGASYFRLVGPGQVYGISARGLAINTAEPQGEEFPAFTEFWLVEPGPEDNRLTIFALLDSPSVSGAYRFDLSPDAPTTMDVRAQLFAREDIAKLGVAPLTSMFLYGENSTRFYDDFRPEVHDSDGVLMHTAGNEWIWRPLTNPTSLHVSSLQDINPRGFGLLQRDREFDNYLDAEADYHLRPSLWIEPHGDWGEGRVELVEIPTSSETNDNIAAYWVPTDPVEAGDELQFNYRIRVADAGVPEQQLARVVRTRIGHAALPGEDNPPPANHRQFVVDFQGGQLDKIAPSLPVKAQLELASGEFSDLNVIPLPGSHGWRVAFKLQPDGSDPVDMRLFITMRDQRLSEVWNYVWYPDALQ